MSRIQLHSLSSRLAVEDWPIMLLRPRKVLLVTTPLFTIKNRWQSWDSCVQVNPQATSGPQTANNYRNQGHDHNQQHFRPPGQNFAQRPPWGNAPQNGPPRMPGTIYFFNLRHTSLEGGLQEIGTFQNLQHPSLKGSRIYKNHHW